MSAGSSAEIGTFLAAGPCPIVVACRIVGAQEGVDLLRGEPAHRGHHGAVGDSARIVEGCQPVDQA
jgi:hypothetical protein